MAFLLIARRTAVFRPSNTLVKRTIKITDNVSIWSKLFGRQYTTPPGAPGSGAGKGGGAGGSIKEAGGGLGRLQVAHEEGYFYNKQRKQLEKLKKQLSENPDDSLKKKGK